MSGTRLSILLLVGCARQAEPSIGSAPEGSRSAPSATVAPLVGAETPEAAWKGLLAAMQAGDDLALARFATPNGIASLDARVTDEPRHTAFRRWGKGWAAWEIRFRKRTADRAEAVLGPEVKEHGLVFVRAEGTWKFERWTPGD